MWMNEHDVDVAFDRHHEHPVLGPAVYTLASIVSWTNGNSDGWPYWQKPARAADKLMDLIQDHDKWDRSEYRHPREGAEATVAAFKAALRPIKAFRTRQAATFDVFEAVEDIEAWHRQRAEARETAERAELARLQEKYS